MAYIITSPALNSIIIVVWSKFLLNKVAHNTTLFVCNITHSHTSLVGLCRAPAVTREREGGEGGRGPVPPHHSQSVPAQSVLLVQSVLAAAVSCPREPLLAAFSHWCTRPAATLTLHHTSTHILFLSTNKVQQQKCLQTWAVTARRENIVSGVKNNNLEEDDQQRREDEWSGSVKIQVLSHLKERETVSVADMKE